MIRGTGVATWHGSTNILVVHRVYRWQRGVGRPPRLADLTVELARRYAESLSEPARSGAGTHRRGRPLIRATVRGHLKALKAFAGWLRREGYLGRDPLASLEVPRDDRRLFPVFRDDQLAALLRVADGESLRSRRWTAVLWFLLDTGLRLGELTGLTLERVDRELGTARVVGKGGRSASCRSARPRSSRSAAISSAGADRRAARSSSTTPAGRSARPRSTRASGVWASARGSAASSARSIPSATIPTTRLSRQGPSRRAAGACHCPEAPVKAG